MHSVFLVEHHVSSIEIWEGERRPERLWRPGDVAFLPRNSDLSSVPNRPYHETILYIEDDALIKTVREYMDSTGVLERFADITSTETTSIGRTLKSLITSGDSDAWPLLTDSLTMAMVVAITKQLSSRVAQAMEAEKPGLSPERIKRVQDFIEANLGSRIRLDAMADAAALSPYHFCRSFKEVFGVSPIRYVHDRRVSEAKHLMTTTNRSLAEIALDCGFASQSHMCAAFKTLAGVTPSEYRRGSGARRR
ncbi:MAG: AraC family transcriptional regulator, partial [Armatimonadia bacterium]